MKPIYDYIPSDARKDLIVFLHGLGCSRRSFDNVIQTGLPNKYSLLNIDLIGFGESEKPTEFDYKMESQAEIVSDLLDEFEEYSYHLVLHSMGGAVGLLLEDDVLKNTVSIANLEGNLIGADCNMLSRKIIKFSEDKYVRSVFSKHLRMFSRYPQIEFQNSSAVAVYRSSESLVEWSDSGELLKRFKTFPGNKSYFWGEQNNGMEVLGLLDPIRKIEIPDAGHFMMTDNPEHFGRCLREFLNREIISG